MSGKTKFYIIILYMAALAGCAGQGVKEAPQTPGAIEGNTESKPDHVQLNKLPAVKPQKPSGSETQRVKTFNNSNAESAGHEYGQDNDRFSASADKSILLGVPFSINYGEQRSLLSSDLVWKLRKIEDQRCPLGIACEQQGSATLTLEISRRDKSLGTVQVNRINSVVIDNLGVFERYQIEVIKLQPYPTEHFVSPRAYIAELIVKKVQ